MAAQSTRGAGDRIGYLLRRHRRQVGITQEDLAARAGVSPRTIGNLENGRGNPRAGTIRLIAEALDLSADAQSELARTASAEAAESPDQLPMDVPDFTGRVATMTDLRSILAAGPGPAPAVAMLVGPPGAGKSALAIHIARSLASDFPDGQLYVDLRGGQPNPLPTGDALGQLLRGLGLSSALPADPAERAALYRSTLAGRRLVVVLDDAATEAQLRPLLPGSSASAVLVTGRRRLMGLPGVTTVDVGMLSTPDAVELLGRILGATRVAADQAAAERIVLLCDGLPLAIRIAGARLAVRPQWPLGRLADLLADSRRRLNELATGDLAVRASIDLTYQALSAADRRAMRRLAVLDVPVLPGWIVAAALDTLDLAVAEEAADRLVDVSLLMFVGTGRDGSAGYRFHDLLRVYGQEVAVAEDAEDDRSAVLVRTMSAALGLADEAADLGPHRQEWRPRSAVPRIAPAQAALDVLRLDPGAWFEQARPVLTALTRQAAVSGCHDAVWDLAVRLLSFYELGYSLEDWQSVLASGLGAARLNGRAAVPLLLRRHGDRALSLGAFTDAERYLHTAAEMSARLGNDDGLGWAKYLLGVSAHGQGQLDGAMEHFREAESAFEAAGKVPVLAHFGMGAVLRERGDNAGALDRFERAVAGARAQQDNRKVAHLLRWLAELRADLGLLEEAERDLTECTQLHGALGDRLGAGYALQLQAELRLRAGSTAAARTAVEKALTHFAEIGSRQGEALALRTSARCALAAGDAATARNRALRAVALYGELDMNLGKGRSLAVVAETEDSLGDQVAALAARTEAALLAPLGVPEAAELERQLSFRRLGQ